MRIQVAGADLIDLSEDMVGGIIVGATAPATTGADSWDLLSSGAPSRRAGETPTAVLIFSANRQQHHLLEEARFLSTMRPCQCSTLQSAVGGTLGGIGGLGMTAGVGGMDTVGMGAHGGPLVRGSIRPLANAIAGTCFRATEAPREPPPLPSSATGGLISRGGGMVPTSGFGPDGAPVGGVRLPGLGEGLPAGGARYRDSLGALGQVDAHEANPFA